MILKSIQLKNFRKHKNISIDFSERLNYIVGENGQGKTTILESIFYLCTTKSHNSKSDTEVVAFNENEFEIMGKFRGITENNSRVYYTLSQNRKYYFKDDKQVSRAADVIGKFPVVLLSPEDHSITQGSPSDRRRFVDSVISQANETYLSNLIDYNKILKQRSALLNQLKETRNKIFFDELQAWSSVLIQTGSYLIKQRKKFLKEFSDYVSGSYEVIMGSEEKPFVEYSFLNGYKRDDIEDEFKRQLQERREEEIIRGTNLIGPQRDEFIFSIDNCNLKIYGSQGQHKTFQVVLRFAEFFYLKELTGTEPIFLLDDVFGELDAKRAERISDYLTRVGQAFITVTDLADFSFLKRNEMDKIIKLSGGELKYA
jgi:DNA replication and repair protein RecF